MLTSSYTAMLLALVIGYLFGSIPFGMILTRLAGTQDLRAIGSGNIGATNVLRTGRKGLAAATLLGDLLKGTVAVLIAGRIGGPSAAMLGALGAILGHLFPVWLGFKGGKGVATYIGTLLGLFWPAAIAFCLIWLVVAWLTKYSSAAALVASLLTPILLWADGQPALAALFAALTILLWIMHRGNIARLRAGTEGRIGKKAPRADESPMAGHNGGPPLGDT
jgi:glycerol-3-phosphate acyltransferase PlsY